MYTSFSFPLIPLTSMSRAWQLLLEQASMTGEFPRSPSRLASVALKDSSSCDDSRGVKHLGSLTPAQTSHTCARLRERKTSHNLCSLKGAITSQTPACCCWGTKTNIDRILFLMSQLFQSHWLCEKKNTASWIPAAYKLKHIYQTIFCAANDNPPKLGLDPDMKEEQMNQSCFISTCFRFQCKTHSSKPKVGG